MMGLLLSLGIEKGKEFKPDAATQRFLAQSADATDAWLMNRAAELHDSVLARLAMVGRSF